MERSEHAKKILKQVLVDVYEKEYEDLCAEPLPRPFSASFERKMKRLLKTKSFGLSHHMSVRRFLLAAALSVILTASLLFSVSALREPIMRFFVAVYEKFSAIVFQKDDTYEFPNILIQRLEPSDLPNGFMLIPDAVVELDNERTFVYRNSNDDQIVFKQFTITSVNLIVDTEGITTTEFSVNGQEGLYYVNKNVRNILWTDKTYGYSVKGNVSQDILLAVAESVPPAG